MTQTETDFITIQHKTEIKYITQEPTYAYDVYQEDPHSSIIADGKSQYN